MAECRITTTCIWSRAHVRWSPSARSTSRLFLMAKAIRKIIEYSLHIIIADRLHYVVPMRRDDISIGATIFALIKMPRPEPRRTPTAAASAQRHASHGTRRDKRQHRETYAFQRDAGWRAGALMPPFQREYSLTRCCTKPLRLFT